MSEVEVSPVIPKMHSRFVSHFLCKEREREFDAHMYPLSLTRTFTSITQASEASQGLLHSLFLSFKWWECHKRSEDKENLLPSAWFSCDILFDLDGPKGLTWSSTGHHKQLAFAFFFGLRLLVPSFALSASPVYEFVSPSLSFPLPFHCIIKCSQGMKTLVRTEDAINISLHANGK